MMATKNRVDLKSITDDRIRDELTKSRMFLDAMLDDAILCAGGVGGAPMLIHTMMRFNDALQQCYPELYAEKIAELQASGARTLKHRYNG